VTSDVELTVLDDGIFALRIQRPERMNALGVQTVADLRQGIAQAVVRKARVLLVCGSGRAFCAGADLKERAGMDAAARLLHNAGINAAINALAEVPCATVAVLNGMALGGGLEMALACDLRLAAQGVALGLTESRMGIFPGAGGTQRLARLVGPSRALHMMLSGEPVDTAHALDIGLVNEVVPAEVLEDHALAFARLLASRSGRAQALIKRLVWQGIERPLAQGLQLERDALPASMASEDYAEGLAAFAQKRPPRFPGNGA
jgi:enoyl-CoA hydratase/carnithine racemase